MEFGLQVRHRLARLPFAAVVAGLVLAGAGAGFAGTYLAAGRSAGGEPPAAAPQARAVATATPTWTSTPTATATPTPTPDLVPAPVDGVLIPRGEFERRRSVIPVGVMVDNSALGHPQYGLSRADLVIEAFVEGGITRYLGVFWRQEAERIEPVRSVRTPFLLWVSELGGMVAHAGGAEAGTVANAIAQIREWGIPSVDALTAAGSGAFYREGDRRAPYNLVTSTEELYARARALGREADLARAWQYKDDFVGTDAFPLAGLIEVSYQDVPRPWDLRQWRWDPKTNTYLRWYLGGPDVDALTGEQLRFKNVIVMRVPAYVADRWGHVLLEQIGEGDALVFLDGRVIACRWRKESREARTRFYLEDGTEVALNRGPTFIQVVAPHSYVRMHWRVDGLPPLPPYEPPVVPDPAHEPDAPTPTPLPTDTPTPTWTPLPTETPTPTPTFPPTSLPSPTPAETATPAPGDGTGGTAPGGFQSTPTATADAGGEGQSG